jgi:oligosaccharyltransferase complex subunit alpha (ribophorin I)
MRVSTSISSLLLTVTVVLAVSKPAQNFLNTAVARTVELGGATTSITTQYNVKAQTDAPGSYHLALANEGEEEPAWWEIQVGGKFLDGLESSVKSG